MQIRRSRTGTLVRMSEGRTRLRLCRSFPSSFVDILLSHPDELGATVRVMRRFNSYGPSDAKAHFAVERHELVERCVQQLVGDPEEASGHYFTLWGPRQTGKTWIMRRAIEEIRKQYGDRFLVGTFSMGSTALKDDAPEEAFLDHAPRLFDLAFGLRIAPMTSWQDWMTSFRKDAGVFDRPVILLIDEFDDLPRSVLDRLVRLFREIFLNRENYVLHGLALIGVRAVLGVDSARGSPFNVQRSLQVPRLTSDEVVELFRQYQAESGQIVEPNVVEALYESTRGQPGLVGWFGELLAEKYNPGPDKPITLVDWRRVYVRALYTEWNNTMLNLVAKARGEYRPYVMKLFTDPNVPFVMDKPWCSYLFMNGIIDEVVVTDEGSSLGERAVCRFMCSFVQRRLYGAFTDDMFGDKGPLPAIPVGDALDDVFTSNGLNAVALLMRYRDYLKRLKAKGIDPWIGQPRRQDLHYTEAVGHFHLYAWLQNALGRAASVYPEFPTGNGKVDLLLRSKQHTAVIEVKSFTNMYELRDGRVQAAQYAKKLGLTEATLVVFAPTDDDAVLEKLADDAVIEGIRVITVPFGWV